MGGVELALPVEHLQRVRAGRHVAEAIGAVALDRGASDEIGQDVQVPGDVRIALVAQRPLVCRGYDCRKDARIWESFEDGIPNPQLANLY